MSVRYICDGYGSVIDGEPHERGFVIRRHYCESAAAVVDEYQAEVDALHAQIAQQWAEQIQRIRARYLESLKSLPDVPDPAEADES